jgi:hypothetical protein
MASPSFDVKIFYVRHLHSEVVTHILDLHVRVCRNFGIVILIDFCFGKSALVRCFGKSRELRSSHLVTVFLVNPR